MIFGVLIQYIQENIEELIDNGAFSMENRTNCKICQKKMKHEELTNHQYSEVCRKVLSKRLKHLRSKLKEENKEFIEICHANDKLVEEMNDIANQISSIHNQIEATVIAIKQTTSEFVETALIDQLEIEIVHKEKEKQKLIDDLEHSAIRFYENNETAYNENEDEPMIV